MYDAIEGTRLYDFRKGIQTDISLKSGNSEIDILAYLDDITSWINDHPKAIKDKYIPFSCLAVGPTPEEVSAFLYGCFVGRSLEKEGLRVESTTNKINKHFLAEQVKQNIHEQMDWFKELLLKIEKAEKEEEQDDQI